jgi:hypothetical protein
MEEIYKLDFVLLLIIQTWTKRLALLLMEDDEVCH